MEAPVAGGSAALGLPGNWLLYREEETLVIGLVVAVPVLARFAWATGWGHMGIRWR